VSGRERPVPFWLVGVIVGAFAAVVAMGPQSLGPALAVGGGGLGWALWRRWRALSASNSVLTALKTHWATLPGAILRPDAVSVHHGDQPLTIRLAHAPGQAMRARISTLIGEQPMAFRVWPSGHHPPTLTPDGRAGSGPALHRSAMVESWLAGRFQAESNDEERLVTLIGQDVTAALFSLADSLGEGFEGVAYDGQSMTVTLRGSVVADPERALQVARVVWRTFMP
jgi:hypothetical protein